MDYAQTETLLLIKQIETLRDHAKAGTVTPRDWVEIYGAIRMLKESTAAYAEMATRLEYEQRISAIERGTVNVERVA